MGKNYTNKNHLSDKTESLKPRKVTIKRILAFSKAYQPKDPIDDIIYKN